MAKSKGTRSVVVLENKSPQGVYRYYTIKNHSNTAKKLVLRKYSPVTKKHEVFKEIK